MQRLLKSLSELDADKLIGRARGESNDEWKKEKSEARKRSFIQAIGSLVLLYFQWVVNSFVDIFSDPWII